MSRPPISDVNNKQGLLNLGSIPAQSPVAAFNAAQVENLLQTKSIEAYHIKHAPNPDRESLGSPISPDSQTASQRGFVYYSVRKLGVVPTNVSLEHRFQVQALYDTGSIVLNVTGEYYDDIPGKDKHVYVRPHDLIILNPSITVATSQLFEFNPTGPQKLYHRVVGVDVLFDSERSYTEGQDFAILDGKIVWLQGGQKPSFSAGKGAILSCVYYINQVYIVQNLPHSLRILPSNPIGHAALPRDATYAPQLLVCRPSSTLQESELLKFDLYNIPNINDYRASWNTTGGST
jgi:hypothetical protein